MDAHRESLFAILGPRLPGAAVLDLFGGTGAFVLEALSRGAGRAVVVERARAALVTLRQNVQDVLGADAAVRVVSSDSYRRPPVGSGHDLVFVAPPYPHFKERRGDLSSLLVWLLEDDDPVLAADGRVVVQYEKGDFAPAAAAGYSVVREKTFGRTVFLILERA